MEGEVHWITYIIILLLCSPFLIAVCHTYWEDCIRKPRPDMLASVEADWI